MSDATEKGPVFKMKWIRTDGSTEELLEVVIYADPQASEEGPPIRMAGWMNREAFELTFDSVRNPDRHVFFWTRKNEKLWHKGETSGAFLEMLAAWLDCDGDTLCIKIKPTVNVCHHDTRSCFTNQIL